MSDPIRLLVTLPPRTKKTSNGIGYVGRRCPVCKRGRPIVLPSEAWTQWVARAHITGDLPRRWPLESLPARPYNCAALFYREALTGDSHGFFQGLADLLQERKVIPDDKWLASWDGSRLLKDAARPRVELTLTPA